MGDNSSHINYSLTDIERYLQGSMTAKEMHDIERAALQDAFLADAIEGYSNAGIENAHKHLNEITAALQAGKEEGKVITMPAKTFGWLRVAASVIVLAGIGVVSWLMLNKTTNTNSLAKNETVIQQEADTIKAKDKKAKEKPALNESAALLKADENKQPAERKSSQKIVGSSPVNKETDKRIVMKDEEASTISMAAAKPKNDSAVAQLDSVVTTGYTALSKPNVQQSLQGKAAGLPSALNEFKGRVTDANNAPVPNAAVQLNNSATAITDINGYFNIKTPDSAVNANVTALGFAPVTASLKNNTINNIVVDETNLPLQEVAVTQMNLGKKTGTSTTNKQQNQNGSMPEGGWQSFQEYVYKKLGKTYDSTNSDGVINGEIDLEFLINENGSPYNFKVLHSADDKTTSEAIEAIKRGPHWITTKKERKARVTLKF